MKEDAEAKKAQVAATYNAASDYFDDSPLAFWDKFGRRTVERLSLPTGSSVLDVGCGSGASALPAAEIVGSSGTVIGIDLAERLLQLGRTKATARGLQNIEFQLGDMTGLDFPDCHFDAVVSVFSIFFVDDMESQVADLWRMVSPGGVLAITTWGRRLFEPAETAWWDVVRHERPDLYSRDNPWDRIVEPASLRKLFIDAGIPVVDLATEEGRQVFGSPEDWWTVVMGSGNRGTMDQMSADAAERVRKESLRWAMDNQLSSIETNVMYAIATKDNS